MLNKTKCKYCSYQYDIFEDKCPACEHPNENKPRGWSFNAMTFIPLYRQILLFLLGWLGLQIIALILAFIVEILDPNILTTGEISQKSYLIIEILSYSLLLVSLLSFLGRDLLKLSRSFRNKFSLIGILCGAAIIGVSTIYGLIISNVPVNANEQAVEDLVVYSPFVSFVMVVILGPFCEELTYRVGLYSFLRRKNVVFAVILSSLIFALIHFDTSPFLSFFLAQSVEQVEAARSAIIIELLNIPSYLIAGSMLALTYEYFGFAGSLYAHTFNNLVGWISTIVLASSLGPSNFFHL